MRAAAPAEVWRGSLLTACVLIVAATVAEVAIKLTLWGGFHVAFVTTPQPFVDAITNAAAQPALQNDDLVDLSRLSPAQRFAWRYFDVARGQRVTLPIRRAGQPMSAEIRATPAAYFGKPFISLGAWPFWLAITGYIWITLFAALIAWRRPESVEARLLTLLLLSTVAGTMLVNWRATLPALDDGLNLLGAVIGTCASAFLTAFAMLFQPASFTRRLLAWLSYASVAAASGIVIAGAVGLATLTIDPAGPLLSGRVSQIIYNLLPVLFPLLCAAVTIAQTRGAERTRVAWATGSLCALYAIDCIAELAVAFFPSVDLNVIYLAENTAFFIAPIPLTYALLSRRLLDIGFVLNRAAIFGAVSSLVVGLFVLFEWALGGWLAHASHTTNVAFSAGLALVLGLSVNLIHGRVEHLIDNLFFHRRHKDEQALRAFAHDAAYITDLDELLGRTVAALETHASASSVLAALDDGSGAIGGVAADDPAIVQLRSRHEPVALHDLESELPGEIAFPMVSRGRLMGALVLGPKRSGEAYAPDEADAIRHVAHGLGTALDVLASHSARRDEGGFDTIEALAEQIAHAVAHSLPDAIDAQLRAGRS